MPYSGHAFDLIQLIASVIKPDGLYIAALARIVKLFWLQSVMELPGSHEILKHVPLSDFDATSNRIFFFVGTSGLSHSNAQSYWTKINKNYPRSSA